MIESIGIVGAGTMGNGIAQVCAAAGLHVTMVDISDAALARGMSVVTSSLERMVNTLAMINRSRKVALPYTIVPTLFDRRTQASMGTLKLLRDSYPEHIWKAYVPIDTRLRDASRAGVTPSQFDNKSRAVLAYRALLKDLLSQQLVAQVA